MDDLYEQKQKQIDRYCDEYLDELAGVLDSISPQLKGLREYYEPLIGFENIQKMQKEAYEYL